jgi:hypothetical protein
VGLILMINLPDFLPTTKGVRIHNRTALGQLLGQLLLLSALALNGCSHDVQDHLKAGTADYSHYPAGGGLFVGAAFSADGRLWRVVPEKQHVYVDYSTDLGKTFSAPVLINAQAQHIKVSGENRPGIAVDGTGKIYVVFAAEGTQPVTSYFSVSSDNGHSFSVPAPVSNKAAEANSFQARLALNTFGQAYIFWHDERDRTDWKQLGNAIYYTTIDGHGGLAAAKKLADTICECCRVAAAFDADTHPVLFTRFIYDDGIRDHGLIKTQTDGKPPLAWRVTFDEWNIEACPDHGPAIAISDDNKYHIAWFTQGNKHQGLFYAFSSDRGQHFSNPLSFGAPDKLPSHPDIMAKGQHITLSWIEFDGSKTQLMIKQSHDSGQTWLPAKAIAESAAEVDFPFLLSNNKSVFVSWNSKNEGYRLIPLN